MGIAQDIIHTVIIHFFDGIVLSLVKYAQKCHLRHCTMIKDYFAYKGKIGLNSKINFRKTQNSIWTHMGDQEIRAIFKRLAENLGKTMHVIASLEN